METTLTENSSTNETKNSNGEKTAQDSNDFRIELTKFTDFEKYIKFLSEHFSDREPLTVALNVDPNEITEFMRHLLISWIDSGSSICTIHVPTNQLAGVLFTKILTRDDTITFDVESQKILSDNHRKLVKVLNHLESLVNLFADPQVNKILEIAVVATNPEFAGNRLAYKMIEESENLGQKLGCQIATMQATNVITQHISRKIGYEECASLDYLNIVVDDTKIEIDPSNLKGTTSGTVVKKYLKKT